MGNSNFGDQLLRSAPLRNSARSHPSPPSRVKWVQDISSWTLSGRENRMTSTPPAPQHASCRLTGEVSGTWVDVRLVPTRGRDVILGHAKEIIQDCPNSFSRCYSDPVRSWAISYTQSTKRPIYFLRPSLEVLVYHSKLRGSRCPHFSHLYYDHPEVGSWTTYSVQVVIGPYRYRLACIVCVQEYILKLTNLDRLNRGLHRKSRWHQVRFLLRQRAQHVLPSSDVLLDGSSCTSSAGFNNYDW